MGASFKCLSSEERREIFTVLIVVILVSLLNMMMVLVVMLVTYDDGEGADRGSVIEGQIRQGRWCKGGKCSLIRTHHCQHCQVSWRLRS